METLLIKGNEALTEGAIRGGCRFYAGYPITPQTEILEMMSWRQKEVGGVFIQGESEIASVNMVMGACALGARAMTSSSGPGFSLKQEGIAYWVSAGLPAVVACVQRYGIGDGFIGAGQDNYWQAVKGGGNGDYRTPVFAPASVQEAVDMIIEAFDVADVYRTPVMVVADGMIGQMMEPVDFDKERKTRELPEKTWAANGTKGERKPNVINSLYLQSEELEQHNLKLEKKYQAIEENEVQYEMYNTEDAELVFVAYGTVSRIVKTTVDQMREEGHKVGLIRPKTLWPFPKKAFDALGEDVVGFLSVEMSILGQMVDDIKLATLNKYPVECYNEFANVPDSEIIVQKAKEMLSKYEGGVKYEL